MEPLKCYLVEDSPIVRDNLIAALEDILPVQFVGTAEDESAAVAWLRGGQADCDLMLIDLMLKSGSGFGVLREARAQGDPRKKLVVVSSYTTPDVRRRCRELEADRVFDKSNELEQLFDYCDAVARRLPV